MHPLHFKTETSNVLTLLISSSGQRIYVNRYIVFQRPKKILHLLFFSFLFTSFHLKSRRSRSYELMGLIRQRQKDTIMVFLDVFVRFFYIFFMRKVLNYCTHSTCIHKFARPFPTQNVPLLKEKKPKRPRPLSQCQNTLSQK